MSRLRTRETGNGVWYLGEHVHRISHSIYWAYLNYIDELTGQILWKISKKRFSKYMLSFCDIVAAISVEKYIFYSLNCVLQIIEDTYCCKNYSEFLFSLSVTQFRWISFILTSFSRISPYSFAYLWYRDLSCASSIEQKTTSCSRRRIHQRMLATCICASHEVSLTKNSFVLSRGELRRGRKFSLHESFALYRIPRNTICPFKYEY